MTGGLVVGAGTVVVVVAVCELPPPPDDATTAIATIKATMATPKPTSPTVMARRDRPDAVAR